MIEKVYSGNVYIDKISHGTDNIKYNENKNIGNHLKLLTKSGVYNLDYDLNMIDCELNKGIEYEIKNVCYSSDNYIYILSGEYVVRKFTVDLEEVAIYRSQKEIIAMTIDEMDNVYLYGGNYLIKLDKNLQNEISKMCERIVNVIRVGNDNLFITQSTGVCSIIDPNTLMSSSKTYYFSEITRGSYVDNEGNYYVYSDDKIAKLDKDFRLVTKVSISSSGLCIKDSNTIYAIKTGGKFVIKKLNSNLEVVASYEATIRADNYEEKDGFFMFHGMDGAVKLNENLEVLAQFNGSYISETFVDENLNLYIVDGGIYKYNDKLEKIKEVPFDKYVSVIHHSNNKIYLPTSSGLIIYNYDLELIKTIESLDKFNYMFDYNGNLYGATVYYDLYKINEALDSVVKFEKIGKGFESLLFDGRIYTINNDGKIRRFNNKMEDVNSLDLNSNRINKAVINDNIYVVTGYETINKIDKGLSKISKYTDRELDEIFPMKDSNNIIVVSNNNKNIYIINSEFKKIAEYKYTGNSYPYWCINDYIYCVDDYSVIKLDKSLSVIATYNVENIDYSLNKQDILFLEDGSVIVIYNDNEVIKLNNNLEEVKKYVSSQSVYGLYNLEDGNIAIYISGTNIIKLNNNLEEICSLSGSSPERIFIINEHYYIFTTSRIIKTNYNLEVVKEVSTEFIEKYYIFNNGIYLFTEYMLTKYNENLEIVNTIGGIYFKDLIEVI